MKPLRVLLVSEFPHHDNVRGGVESAVHILATSLSQLQEVEEVLVLNLRMDRRKDEIVRISRKLTVHYAAGQRYLALPTLSFLDVLKSKRIAQAFRPDIVHGQGTDTHGDVATRLGYPSVVTIHGVGTFEVKLREKGHSFLGPLRVWLTQRMNKRVVERAGVVISISEFDRQYCSKIRDHGLVHIPNAVRQEFFEEEPVFPDCPRIAFSGLLIERKNITGLMRAFGKVKQTVPDAILDIAGGAPDKEYYHEILKNINPAVEHNIVFHGNLNGPELTKVIGRASVVVLFSLHENLPVAIAEALTLGKPVVSSRVGAVGELVEDNVNGFLVESRDEDALAECLVKLLKDPQLRRRMGSQGRALALQRWKPEIIAGLTMNAYRLSLGAATPEMEPIIPSSMIEAHRE